MKVVMTSTWSTLSLRPCLIWSNLSLNRRSKPSLIFANLLKIANSQNRPSAYSIYWELKVQNLRSQHICFIYNRVVLEGATVRAAAVISLAKFGVNLAEPTLKKSITVLLNRFVLEPCILDIYLSTGLIGVLTMLMMKSGIMRLCIWEYSEKRLEDVYVKEGLFFMLTFMSSFLIHSWTLCLIQIQSLSFLLQHWSPNWWPRCRRHFKHLGKRRYFKTFKFKAGTPRREVWWLDLGAKNQSLESIKLRFEDCLDRFLSSSSNSLLRHITSPMDNKKDTICTTVLDIFVRR